MASRISRSVLLLAWLAGVTLVGCQLISPVDDDPGRSATATLTTERADPASEATPSDGRSGPPPAPATAPGSPSPDPPAVLGESEIRSRREARELFVLGDLEAAREKWRSLTLDRPAPAAVLVEQAALELAAGEAEAARDAAELALAAEDDGNAHAAARLLLAEAELVSGRPLAALAAAAPELAPDGLGDLVAVTRARAYLVLEDRSAVRAELGRPEVRESTNRVILESAGELADRAGDAALAADLYARATPFPAWTAQRGRLLEAAGDAYGRAGATERAIFHYRELIEQYGWTDAARRAALELERLGGATPYHHALAALGSGRREEARQLLDEAAAAGPYREAAARRLRDLDERDDWLAADETGTPEAYRDFLARHPAGNFAAEARFLEGLAHLQRGAYDDALRTWNAAIAFSQGDELARLHLWAGKTLAERGREAEARRRWQAAVDTPAAGYYAARSRDLLAGVVGWPMAPSRTVRDEEAEAVELARWLAGLPGDDSASALREHPRVRRGLGLVSLGRIEEAAAEFNGLIAESEDVRFLFHLAELLDERRLWYSSARAAMRGLALQPDRSVGDLPAGVLRLAYPPAYEPLILAQAAPRGVDPLLLLALIRQESSYDPYAISVAEARGLTQVIPSTGRGIAGALGRRDFEVSHLFRPALAVEFGAWYLANQLSQFDGDPFRALAAYNAGAGPIVRWAAADPDLFVERIDYPETKRYVRQLYLHHAVYRSLTNSD